MIKPKQLKRGDSLAVLSPSWGGPSLFPKIFEKGIENLESLGFRVVEYPTARMDAGTLSDNPQLRAQDINRAFRDESIQGIISTIGGDDSVRILKHLDIQGIKSHPKFIMGYSDFTTLSSYLNQNDLVTFNGPSVMAGFSQLDSFPGSYRSYLEEFFFSTEPVSPYPRFQHYSDGYPDWSLENSAGRLNPLRKSDGYHRVQGAGSFGGVLFGGCMEVLEMMKGSAFWPERDFWKNRILFLETSEDKPPIDYVIYWLRNYGVMGVYEQISGILFGRARGYSDEEKKRLDDAIRRVVGREFGCSDLPVLSNVDFGHSDPQIILPLGIQMEVDMETGRIMQKERAFCDA